MKEVLILKLLSDGKIQSSKEISEKFEISKSTVKRKISCLRDTGVPIKTITGKNEEIYCQKKAIYSKI